MDDCSLVESPLLPNWAGDVVGKEVEAPTQRLVEVGIRESLAAGGKGGEEDAICLDYFRTVAVEDQNIIEFARQGADFAGIDDGWGFQFSERELGINLSN